MRDFLSGHSSSELMGDVGERLLNPGGGIVVEVGLINKIKILLQLVLWNYSIKLKLFYQHRNPFKYDFFLF